jgi:hypothetical protein
MPNTSRQPSSVYRAYRLDANAHIEASTVLPADNDGEAIRLAAALVTDRTIELWDRTRRIRIFAPTDRAA